MARPHIGVVAELDIDRMRSLGVGKQAFQRIANASPIAELGKGLHKRGVNRDSARAFMQKLKLEPPLGFADRARIAKFILRRRLDWVI